MPSEFESTNIVELTQNMANKPIKVSRKRKQTGGSEARISN